MRLNPSKYGSYKEMKKNFVEYASVLEMELRVKNAQHNVSLMILSPMKKKG